METTKALLNCRYCIETMWEDAHEEVDNKRDLTKAFVSDDLIIDNPSMCRICSNKFRYECLQKNDPEASSAENVKDIVEYEYCCFCQGVFECSQLVDIFETTLKECFSEMTQLENSNPKSCELCEQTLQDFHAFSITCTDSTQKILEFCSVLNITPQDVNMYEVYQFLYSSSTSADTKNILTSAVQLKDEESNTINSVKEHSSQYKSPAKMEVTKKCPFETKQKDCPRKYLLVDKNLPDTKIFKCELCPFETKRKYNMQRHTLKHKDSTEVTIFKCELCPFETKRKYNLQRHTLIHKDSTEVTTFKCEKCDYKTIMNRYLKTHLLIHKSPTEVEMFKCELCPYETKRKDHLRQHSLIHKDSTEVTIFKCEKCDYETKIENYMKRHLLVHKRPTELEMFRCGLCPYETKRKSDLKTHLIIHKPSTNVKMFKCERCNYETKFKASLKRHLSIHKGLKETEILK